MGKSLCCGCCSEDGRGSESRPRFGRLEQVQWALVHTGCPYLSGSWPWVIRAGGGGLECDSLLEEVVGVWALDGLTCIRKYKPEED